MVKTKRGKTLFEYRIKGCPVPHLLGQGRHYTCTKSLLVGQKSRDNARPSWVLLLPEAFTSRLNLAERCMCTPVEDPRVGQVWGKKPDNWPEGRHRLRRTDFYKCDLTASLLCSSSSLGGIPTCFLSLCASLPCSYLNWTNRFSMCSPTSCAMFLIINCTCIYSFCLHDKCVFHWGQGSREN